ncbi:hypothetical protein DY000_02046425 [Brassica cretica]|uniref:Uncharacterized protein n=1 Tax=Brassica cretica TaxID=69181 RepID=A0ABQ7EUB4_BRACR|nr:hypothetical protein DY000_02046425 [Brassica cretica]
MDNRRLSAAEKVVEFPSGDEVTATLVYEQLAKLCSYYYRLDHEARDCLKTKAEKKERLLLTEGNNEETALSAKEAEPTMSRGRTTTGKAPSTRYRDTYRPSPYSRPNENYHRDRYHTNSYPYHDGHRTGSQISPREARHHSRERGLPISGDGNEESSASKKAHQYSARGTPLQIPQEDLPREALEEAIGELHDVMKQYTSIADPTESAARKECYRMAEEQEEIEQTAAKMGRARIANQETPDLNDDNDTSPKRVPALLRLGPSPPPAQLGMHPTNQSEARRKPGRPPGTKKESSKQPETPGGIKLEEEKGATVQTPQRAVGALQLRRARELTKPSLRTLTTYLQLAMERGV